MSDLACNFCAHGNPEGSTFCNECGSPLNLTLCSRCEAINVVWASECSQCGAPLSSGDTEEMAAALTALTEIVQSLERAPTKVDPVLVALAKRLHTVPGAPVLSYEPQAIVEDPGSRAAVPNADPANPEPIANRRSATDRGSATVVCGFIRVASHGGRVDIAEHGGAVNGGFIRLAGRGPRVNAAGRECGAAGGRACA